MGKYNCEKCGKEFNQKSHYTTHINKKNPCVVESKIKEMINNTVKKKIIEIKKISPSDIINNIEIVYDNKLVNVWTYALMPRGINVHTYSGYVHIWSLLLMSGH